MRAFYHLALRRNASNIIVDILLEKPYSPDWIAKSLDFMDDCMGFLDPPDAAATYIPESSFTKKREIKMLLEDFALSKAHLERLLTTKAVAVIDDTYWEYD